MSSPLIPLHHGKLPFPRALKRARESDEGNPWTTMDEKENGIIDVLPPYLDPLINATNAHKLNAIDAIG
jgi:hypothetical protein